ncbi:U6 snRNA-associated Sm-like protein LSm1, putative [Coccidioides posadasii C735 delta SOWgp]|uniref:U6 snRNA-associated Sm-like protein LSm1 n=2 Tax=Coccidioides posadasii TaxID=199306 RepID=E9D7Z5_COCPS|nr:U6 snRNA-associated Sm-like protein LSm1, putative [Coccidioides posadasii C735 delta SOWgp]EER25486.1 U6 snRNA-associated Sm-like protein LSm1, putative [Coccidioides posadasii C735 delta SOWgp]EFW17504.1 small nuclear ribonucleoprotein [Coccidioides posadasii str. Silveira]|eukprot:XP_003067631.1 U6 snRNA-associated Sm-like protein LSm1, putative [Coccidioides posadasii C735 delta SOWgp]
MEHFSPQDTKNVAGRAGGGPSPGPPSQYPQSGRFQQPSPPVGPPHSQQHQMPRGSTPPQQQGGAPVLPSGPPQLPPQLFTTAAQLLDLTDKKLVLILRDGRKLIGVLRSWDQFANLVLQDTVERVYSGNLYGEEPRGVYLVRGENVLLLGEIDLDKEDDIPEPYRQAPYKEVLEMKQREDSERKRTDKRRGGKLQTLGFEAEHSGEVLF